MSEEIRDAITPPSPSAVPRAAEADTATDEPRVTLEVGQEFAPGYRILNRDGSPGPAGPALHIAAGGAGVVFRAAYHELPNRAIKVLAPRQDLLDRVGWDKFEETFTREIRMLARVTHTHVAKILDYGQLEYDGRPHLFYAMDFIDGMPFDRAIAQYEPSARETIEVLQQILDGLGYLHAQEIMHCDLKEENVLVTRVDSGLAATIVDLGVAKTLKAPTGESTGDSPDDDTTTFFSSPKLMMPGWEDRIGVALSREKLLEMFPRHDLYCFGRLVGMGIEPARKQLSTYLGRSGLQALEQLQRDLHERPGDLGTAAAVGRSWRKLPPGWLAPMNVRELAVGGGGQTAVPTPNGRVGVSERIRRTLNHQLVQRLRSIPQLEFLSFVLPGATHTRLLHSLSTFDTARLYLAHLLTDPSFRLMAEPEDIEATLLWALLHDVGHFPLSHMFEDFAHEESRRDGAAPRTIPTDDDLFWCFVDPGSVTGDFAAYPALIDEAARKRGATLGEGLFAFASEDQRFSEDVLAAMRAIAAPIAPIHSVLAGVLSSPIDIDKVSYLQDDSLMSGVRFGMGIDMAGLLNALRMPADAQIKAGEPVMALDDGGLAAAEGVVMARYWMLRRVYWDQENRALMAMAKFAIRRLIDTEQLAMTRYYAENVMGTQDHALRWLSGEFDLAGKRGALGHAIGSGPARRERNPLVGLLDGKREIYARVLTISNDPDRDEEARLYERLAFKDAARTDEMMERLHAVLDGALGRIALRGDVLLDVPFKERERLDVKVWIYSGRRPNDPLELGSSPVVKSLRGEFDQHVKKCRVFLHPAVVVELGDRLGDVRHALQRALRESCGL